MLRIVNKLFYLKIFCLLMGVAVIVIINIQTTISVFAADSYTIRNNGQAVEIDEHNICKTFTNKSPVNVFIPTKTSAEWQSAINNASSNISQLTIGDCITATIAEQCEDAGGTYYDDLYKAHVNTTYYCDDICAGEGSHSSGRNEGWRGSITYTELQKEICFFKGLTRNENNINNIAALYNVATPTIDTELQNAWSSNERTRPNSISFSFSRQHLFNKNLNGNISIYAIGGGGTSGQLQKASTKKWKVFPGGFGGIAGSNISVATRTTPLQFTIRAPFASRDVDGIATLISGANGSISSVSSTNGSISTLSGRGGKGGSSYRKTTAGGGSARGGNLINESGWSNLPYSFWYSSTHGFRYRIVGDSSYEHIDHLIGNLVMDTSYAPTTLKSRPSLPILQNLRCGDATGGLFKSRSPSEPLSSPLEPKSFLSYYFSRSHGCVIFLFDKK